MALGLLLGVAAVFALPCAEMWNRWFPAWYHSNWSLYKRIFEGESYYTHGPLVPLISLVVAAYVIQKTRIPVRPMRAAGLAVLGVSLAMHLLACLARVSFVSGFAFIGVLAGLVLLLWGPVAMRRLWFPIAFLVFLVPLPEVTIAQLNFRLKMLATDWGVGIANLVGVVAERTGNKVFLEGGKSLIIANVCSGLRTLISLLAFGALWAYVCRLRGLWRLFGFAMTVPLAIVSNSLRIVSMILVADIWSVQAATGWYHDTSGILIFVIAFMLMFLLEFVILKVLALLGRPMKAQPLMHEHRRTAEEYGQWRRLVGAMGSRWTIAVAAMLATAAAGTWWLSQSIPSKWTRSAAQAALPRTVTLDATAYLGQDMELDDVTLLILETPEYLYRRYSTPNKGSSVDFCIIFSRDNRKGIHPPDLCLEGSGQDIVAKSDVVVADVAGMDVPCRELVVQGSQESYYFLYTYRCGAEYTRSFWKQQAFILVNGLLDRDSAGAMIRISCPLKEGQLESVRQRSTALLRAAMPSLNEALH